MKKIKIIKLSQEEINQLESSYKKSPLKDTSLKKLISDNENVTLSILRQIKNLHKWNDIENMVDYVSIIKKTEGATEFIELNDKEISIVLDVFDGAVKSGKVNGVAMEKIVEVYKEFKL